VPYASDALGPVRHRFEGFQPLAQLNLANGALCRRIGFAVLLGPVADHFLFAHKQFLISRHRRAAHLVESTVRSTIAISIASQLNASPSTGSWRGRSS
jgi:hypothetical protein